MISAAVVDKRIIVTSPFHAKDRLKAIPGARWDSAARAWTYPISPSAALALRDSFPTVQGCSAFFGLVGQGEAIREAAALKVSETLPGIPNIKTPAWKHQRQCYWFAWEVLA